MAIIHKIEIDGRPVAFDSSAALARIYRARFGRDLLVDLAKLNDALQKNSESESFLSEELLELFEDIAFTMAKQADASIPDTVEEWLDDFNVFSIYQVLPQIVQMWHFNTLTTADPKKKVKAATDP